jgi:dTDP-4-dehydrorhamnose reductase
LSGVYHVSAEPIAKYDLLRRLNDAFRSGVRIDAEGDPHVDRSLDSSRFRQATGWQPPSWDSLVDELASDPTAYERWRTA